MADLAHPAFLLRMNRLAQFMLETPLRNEALLAVFNERENKPPAERERLPFSVKYARDFISSYEEIEFRRSGYNRFTTGLTTEQVVDLMEEDWFKRAEGPKRSASAVQMLFAEMRRLDPAVEFSAVDA